MLDLPVRPPAHAGTFYPADPEELVKVIEWAFLHPLGPGRLPDGHGAERLSIGYIVPHAGYIYSGPVAAHAYYMLSRERPPETVVIIGPNHNGVGHPAAVYRGKAWRTPLGEVAVDNEFSQALVEESAYLAFDNDAHYYEHSLEVQVPFLQYILRDVDFRLAAISVYYQSPRVARDIAGAILRAAEKTGRDIVVIGSTDFNHYEPHDVTVEKDMEAINAILELDEEKLFRVIEEKNITMCGPISAATLIVIAKMLGAPKPRLLKHATSGDLTGEKSWVVGYASIMFPRA